MGEFPTYVAMCRHLNLNMFATKDFVRLSIFNAAWKNVEFLIETLVALRIEQFAESRDTALRSVLAMNEIGQTFLLSNIGRKCLEKYGDCIKYTKLSKIISLLVNDTNRHSELVMRFIRKDYTIVKEKTNRVIQYRGHNTILHLMVRNGWCNEIREIYREFPRLKDVVFANKEIGISALIQAIQSNHIDVAQFLIEEHQLDIDRPEHWTQLLIAASELTESMEFMKMILNHRMTDPNMVLKGDHYTHTNALFVCISKGNLEKLEVILASEKLTELNVIKDRFDVTLLQSAICLMRTVDVPCVGVYDYERRQNDKYQYLTGDLDTSEDETVTSERASRDLNRSNSMEDETNRSRYKIMNEIFDKLIERGANFKHVNASHETLLHHAVERNNKYVLKKLIQLGLDPIDVDFYGNLPIHHVNDIEIFNILKEHSTFQQTLLTKNKNGETILHHFARLKNVSVELGSTLITDGVDVNCLDHLDNTPLHNVQTVAVCELLINSNANLNLKNKNGQTPTHVALTMGNLEIAALQLKQPSLDLFALSNNGKSYLTILSSLTDCYFEKIKPSLDGRKEEFDRLVELYCNETDDDGVSNLFHSTNNKHLLQLLVAQPSIQVNVPNSKYNDLMLHTVGGDVKLAKFFVENGLDVNKVDVHLRTPLLEAITGNQNLDVVKFLIAAGANVNFVGWRGTTPLHVACIYFNLDVIRILLEAGADFNVGDSDGKIPFHHLPMEYREIIQKIIF